jgi:hypothetical protein
VDIAAGIVAILAGIFCLTPGGAAWVARYNRANPVPGSGNQTPRTVRGAQFGGVFVVGIGIAFLLT